MFTNVKLRATPLGSFQSVVDYIGAMKGFLLFCLLLLGLVGSLKGQLLPYPTYQGDGQHLERLSLLAGSADGQQLAIRPYTYQNVASWLQRIDTSGLTLSAQQQWDIELAKERLALVNRVEQGSDEERGLFAKKGLTGWLNKSFYRQRGYAIAVERPGLKFYANPVLNFEFGNQSNTGTTSGAVFTNTRGATVRGEVDGKVWFQTTLYENQARLQSWEREWSSAYNNAVPGVGFFKPYNSSIFDISDGVDFFQATGEVGFNLTKHISARFGHGNPRLGTGYRSLILDNFADPYLFAEIDTRVWKIHYRNVFSQMKDGRQTSAFSNRKFIASHTLGIQLTKAWEVGITEMTVFQRENGFDAQYLNPIILYRAVEQDNGSTDNALIGLYSNLRIGKTAEVYGQILFDEFKFDELIGRTGWWANKQAIQVGGKWFGAFGQERLDIGAEFNSIRPFTFGHRFGPINYVHYDQPLAHPWGADLREFQFRVGYKIKKDWRISGQFVNMVQGDVALSPSPHIGANILYNNNLRGRDFDYAIADERPVKRTYAKVQLSWQPFAGASLHATYDYYQRSTTTSLIPNQHGVSFGFSMNTIQRSGVF